MIVRRIAGRTGLPRVHDLLHRIDQHLEKGIVGLSVADLSARPAGRWSIAEIVEHLGLAFAGTAAGARRALQAGRCLASPSSFRNRVATLLVVEAGYFPSGRKSPRIAEPRGADPATVLGETRRHLMDMDAALADAEARFGASAKFLDHPVIGPLSIRQWRRFHWIHTRHHMRQIAQRCVEGRREGQV